MQEGGKEGGIGRQAEVLWWSLLGTNKKDGGSEHICPEKNMERGMQQSQNPSSILMWASLHELHHPKTLVHQAPPSVCREAGFGGTSRALRGSLGKVPGSWAQGGAESEIQHPSGLFCHLGLGEELEQQGKGRACHLGKNPTGQVALPHILCPKSSCRGLSNPKCGHLPTPPLGVAGSAKSSMAALKRSRENRRPPEPSFYSMPRHS